MKNTVNAVTLPMSKELSLFQRSGNNNRKKQLGHHFCEKFFTIL